MVEPERSPENEGAMSQCRVTVAGYASLSASLADWDAMAAADRERDLGLVDAALVEGDAETIRVAHRHSLTTYGRGTAASAVVGLLRPSSIVTGAVAGGVGGAVLIMIGHGLSRSHVKELGDVLDSAPIAFVILTTGPTTDRWHGLLGAARTTATVQSTMSVAEIHRAIDSDAAD